MVCPPVQAYHSLQMATSPQAAPGGSGSLLQTHTPPEQPSEPLVFPHASVHCDEDVQASPSPSPVVTAGAAGAVVDVDLEVVVVGYHTCISEETEAKTELVKAGSSSDAVSHDS